MKRESFRLVVAISAVALSLGAASANAQSFRGTFTLDRPVHWGQAILPAGNYTVAIDSTEHGSIAKIRGDQKSIMVMCNATREDAAPKMSSLLLIGDSNTPSVRALHLAEENVDLYYPVSKRDLELAAQNRDAVSPVPVVIGGK